MRKKKWIYLVIGLALLANMLLVLVKGLPAILLDGNLYVLPVVFFQSLWGILGAVLVYKAFKLFKRGKEISND